MDNNDLKQHLKSLPVPAVPEGLESHILQAVHAEQQREVNWSRRWRLISLTGLTGLMAASLVLVARAISQTSTWAALETILINRDVLSWPDTALALLEILPLGGITTVLAAGALFFFLLAIRIPRQKLSLNINHNFIFVV